jgi:hypothetical protein
MSKKTQKVYEEKEMWKRAAFRWKEIALGKRCTSKKRVSSY